MWYQEKIVSFTQRFAAVFIIMSASMATAAEKREYIRFSEMPGARIGMEEKPDFRNSTSARQGRELIANRELNIWGLALFLSDDPIGVFIKKQTNADWSHCGTILQDEKDQSLYCFESTGSASDVLRGIMPHVQIHTWQEVWENYNGKVAYRRLVFEGKAPTTEEVLEYVDKNLGRPYEKNIQSLINVINRNNKAEALDSLFCSEMVADFIIKLGYLDPSQRLAGNYLPKDFSDKEFLPWINGARLAEQIVVKKKATTCSRCVIL